MREFRIEDDGLRRQNKVTAISFGLVLSPLLAVALFVVFQGTGFLAGVDLGPMVGACIGGMLLGGYFMAGNEALNRADRQRTFVLDDSNVTRKKPGFADVTIRYSDISFLGEQLKWLVVQSAVSATRISIPRDVSGYELIRAELATHHPLSPRVKYLPSALLLRSALPWLASLAGWAAIVWSRDLRIVAPAGAVAIYFLGSASYRFWISLPRVRRWLASICLGPAWLIAAILIYRAAHR